MAEIFRPVYYIDPITKGRTSRKKCPGAIRVQSRTYWIRYYVGGARRKVKGFDDLKATKGKARKLEEFATQVKHGVLKPSDEHASRPLDEHLEDFGKYLRDKGNSSSYVAQTVARVHACLAACGFERIVDVQASHVQSFLAGLLDESAAPQLDRDTYAVGELAALFAIKRASFNAILRRCQVTPTKNEEGQRIIERPEVEKLIIARAAGRRTATANH